MTRQYNVLFTPMKIGSMEVKNRYVTEALGGSHVFNMDGTYDKEGCGYFIERAKGSIGLLVTGATLVAPMGSSKWLYEQKPAFMATSRMTAEVHRYGSKILLQPSAGSGRTMPGDPKFLKAHGLDPKMYFVAPTDGLPNVWNPSVKHRGLTAEDSLAVYTRLY